MSILGLGNPLLDISAKVPKEFLEKYGLKSGNAILAEDKHKPLYGDMESNHVVEYMAGGATQNTMRGIQWLLGDAHKGVTAYIGCVGDDDHAKKLRAEAEKDGVQTHYMVKGDVETGTCGVLVVDRERSLVANLAAANCYSEAHIQENWAVVEKAELYYSSGFFLTVSPESILRVAKHATEKGKTLAVNLAAPFIVEFFWTGKLEETVRHADIVFGNDDEAKALGKARGWGEDLVEIAQRLATLPKEGNGDRTVVITCGCDPVIVVSGSKPVQTFPVPLVPQDAIIDTNGAGDSFVAGFLSQHYLKKDLETCVKVGNYCASHIIQTSGVVFNGSPNIPQQCNYE